MFAVLGTHLWPLSVYWKSRLVCSCLKLLGSSLNRPFWSMCIRGKKSLSCLITASAPTNDHAQIRSSTLWVCKQQNSAMHSRWIKLYSPLVNILLRRTLSVTPLRNLPVNKRLRNLAELRLSQILHLCTQKSVCATNFGLFGEMGDNFPEQLSSRTKFA